MTSIQQTILTERDTEKAIRALKKGTYLLKYGRWGKPKFCPFRLSSDETLLIWFAGKEEKQLKLSHVSRIIPGQRTTVFQRYPQPKKECQSFSLLYSNRSLDLICKDRDEAEVWFTALRALISQGNYFVPSECTTSDSPRSHTRHSSHSDASSSTSNDINKDPESTPTILVPYESSPQNRLGKAFSEVISYTAAAKAFARAESVAKSISFVHSGGLDDLSNVSGRGSSSRYSPSSASSSQGSKEDPDSLGDILICGEGFGGLNGAELSSVACSDALVPKTLESTVLIDAHNIACGTKHAVIVTKQGQIFSWGQGSGGRLGHGDENDVFFPKLINALDGSDIDSVACGEFHSCAVTNSGDLYTWGDGILSHSLLGHVSEVSHWTPQWVCGQMVGIHVSSISCGPWHTAFITSTGMLYTFGDGTFGALGHGDRHSTIVPREVEMLLGLRTLMASCGVWHTAAIVAVTNENSSFSSISFKKMFTWGDGSKGQLGHGDKESKLIPCCVAAAEEICRVACGQSSTIALTVSGKVYSMGSNEYGQQGTPCSIGNIPTRIKANIKHSQIEDVACGFYHVAILSSKAEVFTWGKGANGQLGHGDGANRNTPTLVEALKGKQVKSVVCGSNCTAFICVHKSVFNSDHSRCSGCQNPFNFRRKRHNCYNCGLTFCKACTDKKSMKAALAPETNKPYRVCNICFKKLKPSESFSSFRLPSAPKTSTETAEKEIFSSFSFGRLSRITSFDSIKQALSPPPPKPMRNSCHVSSTPNGCFQWESTSASQSSNKPAASPPLNLRMFSRPPTPVFSMPMNASSNRPVTTEATLHNSKQTNDHCSEETVLLKAQVEDLTRKSQLLEAEVDKISQQLKDTAAAVKEEAEKNEAAQEIIRSLTARVKELTENKPQEPTEEDIEPLE